MGIYELFCFRAQVELSSTFVYDYKMSTGCSSAFCQEFSPQQGGRTTMMHMPANRTISQAEKKYREKYYPYINI